MKTKKFFLLIASFFFCSAVFAQEKNTELQRPQTPIMGWSSWNNFRVNINEDLIKAQADAMVSSGMKAVGYEYINVDDGFWGGRDEEGNILPHPERFPHGMKAIADYIHSKGFKAGIYSDAGLSTCASMWDADTVGVQMGLYHHEWQDLQQMLGTWGYDFIKVDWCGGQALGLDEETRYTYISKIIREIDPSVVYNVCRWEYPGNWVVGIADSWRISGDIRPTFKSVMHIVDLNAGLWKHAGPGHVNDMDMLQVGRGMTYEEDKTHFSMWCMLASPLLAGNDLRNMSKETIQILTNEEMIAIDQDPLVYQARRLVDNGDTEVWARPLKSTMSGGIAVALLNRAEVEKKISFNVDSLGLIAEKGYTMHDVWSKKDYYGQTKPQHAFEVPGHGIIVLTLKGTAKPYNIFQQD